MDGRSGQGLETSNLDVAFVIDTTGSMRDDIEAVRDSLFEIVDTITRRTEDLRIRFGLVSYRDHPPQDTTYVTKVFDFTFDLKKIHKQISKLRPSEGGDIPEAVADGIYDARTKLSWSESSYKVLVLMGDAPPHGRDYNSLTDDYFPDGCPMGHDPKEEMRALKGAFGSTVFVFVCGCNPLVEESFRSIAESVDDGRYYALHEADLIPGAILQILEDVGDLIEADRKVLTHYESNDGSFGLADAASELGLELRDLKTSLSRLLELGHIPRWPRGRPLSPSQMGLTVQLGKVPDALLAGRPFKYRLKVRNPSSAVIGIRLVVTLITDDGVSEVTNEPHEIGPRADQYLDVELVPMVEATGRATLRVEVFYGSNSIASGAHKVRLY
ncbi:MAG: vWA domain-containing protein [Candidatus Thorarchaeota archaeon]